MLKSKWTAAGKLVTALLTLLLLASHASAADPNISALSLSSGPVGITLTVSGSGFGASQGTSTVEFNGTAATPCSACWSDTSIAVPVPAGATTGNVVVNVGGTNSNGVAFTVTALPASWSDSDIGNVGTAGSAGFANGVFTVKGAGAGIYSTADAFHFAYQTLSGDGSITARVASIQGSSYSQVGVMIRETTAANSTNSFVFFQPNTAQIYERTSTGASSTYLSTGFSSPASPYWLALVRAGSTFSSYISKDGVNWTQVSSTQAITMAETVSIGLAVSSQQSGVLTTATFDNVSVTSERAPAPVISSVSATTGTIGSQVWVYGNNFGSSQSGSVLMLSGAPMIVNSWSDTAISITIPTGAISGLLAVSVAPSMNDSNPVTFTITSQPLPATWVDQDIGTVGLAGSSTWSNGTFTIKAAGQGIGSTKDGFHFVYQPLSGDGTIIARVSNLQNVSSPEAGLMIRETAQADSKSAFVYFAPNAANLDSRATTGGSTTQASTGFSAPSYPYWVMLSRSGNVFSGFVSKDAISWTQVGSQTIVMAQDVFIGMAVSNQTTGTLLSASLDSVSVSSDVSVPPVVNSLSATTGNVGTQLNIFGSSFGPTQGTSTVVLNGAPVTVNTWSDTAISITIPTGATSGPLDVLLGPSMNSSYPVEFHVTTQPLPLGWLDTDIGQVSTSGTATYSSGTFTITATGVGVSGTSDGLHFVYQPLSGDGVLIARVASITNEGGYDAGIMFRDTLNPGAEVFLISFYPNQGQTSYRTSTGGSASEQSTFFAHSDYPYWVKIARTGNSFSAFLSADGVSWTQIGTNQTITMGQTVQIGLVNDSQNASAVTSTYDNVSIAIGTMPIVTGLSPASGGLGAQVRLTGTNFGSTQGSSTVKFNGTVATSIVSWSNNQIVAVVPSGATTGPVTVVVNSIQSNTNFSYTVYNPVITSVTPPVGQYGSIVMVAGTGFGVSQNTGSQVAINGQVASVLDWSDTSLKVAVPSNATSGPLTVSVGGVTSNGIQFSIEHFSITGISPISGPAGTEVTITGTGFGSTQTSSTVDFYGTSAAVQSWSDTQIVATVPTDSPSGPVGVNVGAVEFVGQQFTMTRTIQLTDSLGNQSSYTSALIGGIWLPTVGQGSGCSTCTQRGNISYTYDPAGNRLSRTDENGNVTTYTYDSNGNVLTVTVPINSTTSATTTYTYNSFGEVLTATDPLGNVTTNTYDANGNLLSVTTPAPGNGAAASVTQFAYDTKGELTQITDPLNNATAITYNSVGLIATIKDAQGNTTSYAYDSRGNRTSVTDANSKQTTFTYDAMNRLTKITYPDSTTTQFAYDSRGRRTSVTDQNGKVTSYAYDDADRLLTVTDAANNVTTYGYDTEGNLTSIEDANLHTTSFAYDAFGRVTKTTFPSGYVETYGYDAVGNLTSKTDRKNQQVTYTYDQLNRLTQKTYPDSTAVNYTYDNDSRLTAVTDPTGTYSFTFDNMGRLTGTSTSYSFLTSRSFTTSYGYDKASNRTSFTDPENGSTTYAYDTLNRLQTLTPPSAFTSGSFGFSYDALSRRTQMTRPNSITTNYSYDNLSRLLSVLHKSGSTTLDGVIYTVDNAGNRTSKADQLAGVTSNYTYDPIYELTQVTQGTNTTESYSYDAVGNRTASLGVPSYTTNSSNEMTANSNASYTYDNNGNTLTKVVGSNTTSYSWDFENRLTSVTLPGNGGTVTFKYDPWGRRIYKSSASGTSIYAYDGDDLTEETNSTGAVVARYARTEIIDEPLAMLRSGTTSYYEADGLWSVTSLSNAAGALAQTYTFDSFGKLTNSSGSLTNPFQYNARDFDTETNLYYYRARYYDQNVGRFISEDPINFSGGINFYEYVKNQPIDNFDPFGLKCTKKLMLVTAYCDQGRTASGRFAGPGTVAVANTNAPSRGPDRQPIPYPFGCSVNVSGPLKDPVFNRTPIDPFNTPDYTGTVNDTGAGWDKKHHHVPPDQWIDIWLRSCKQARKYGLQWREVTICCPDDCGK